MRRILFAGLLIASGFARAAGWLPAGPADGGQASNFATVATHPGVGGQAVVFAGYVPQVVHQLGAFFTTDGGAHWTSNARIGIVRRAFLSGTPTIAFLDNDAPILRSTDEGRTWAPIPLPTDASGLALLLGAVNPANPNELVVFAGATIYRTLDGGSSWGSDAAPTTVSALDVDWSTRILYASFTNNPSLGHRPLDTPGAWGVGGQDPYRFAAGHGTVIYSTTGGLYRSTDGGTKFNPVAQGVVSALVCGFAFSSLPANRVYAIECDSGRVLRSDDDGATWSVAGTIADASVRTPAVDAANPDRLYVITSVGALASNDGGSTFAALSRPGGAPGSARALYFDPVSTSRQWLSSVSSSSASTLRSEDAGSTWHDIGSTYRLIGASRARANTVFGTGFPGVTGDYGVSLSTDGGTTWTQKVSFFGPRGTTVGPLAYGSASGELFVAAVGGSLGNMVTRGMFYSNDDGESFTSRFAPPVAVRALGATQSGPSLLYAGGSPLAIGEPQLYRSANGAVTWSPVATFPASLSSYGGTYGNTLAALAIDPSNPARIYAGFTYPDYVMRSDDAGATWTRATNGLGAGEITSLVIDPANPSTIYASQLGSGVFRSTDRGATWAALDEGLHDEAALGVAQDPHTTGRIYAETGSGLYRADLGTGVPEGDRRAIEFYHLDLNHFFVSADLDEIAGLDAGVFQGWARTGEGFRVAEANDPGNSPVCRYFGVFPPQSTHFYSPYPHECEILATTPPWIYEKIAFGLALPTAPPERGCPPDTRALRRFYNNSMGGLPNHRYSTSMVTFDTMVAEGWTFEGEAPTLVFACVPY